MKIVQQNMGIENVPQLSPKQDMPTELWALCLKYNRGDIEKPEHQRDIVWPPHKKKAFVDRLKNTYKRPIGAIATYQLDNGKPSKTWINDGWQRISTCIEFLENPEVYGENKKSAEKILQSVHMPLQHRWYKNHEEALEDFQYINMGTSLTTYEFCHGTITYMSNYGTWKNVLEKVHDIMHVISSQYTGGGIQAKREALHKFRRDDYALFHRFSAKIKTLKNYNSGVSSPETVMKRSRASNNEDIIAKYLAKSNLEDIKKDLENFEGLVFRESEMIKNIWKEKVNPNGEHPMIHATMFRWLIHLSVWKRYNKIPNVDWENFIEKCLSYNYGKTSFPVEIITNQNKKGAKRDSAVSLGKLGMAKKIAKIVGSNLFDKFDNGDYQRRKAPKDIPGRDQGHQEPFSFCGEGKTISEPASRNRARGAKFIK